MSKYIDIWKSWGVTMQNYYQVMPLKLKELGLDKVKQLFPEEDWVEIWRQADEYFGLDPVINRRGFNLEERTIADGNFNNHLIALQNGLPSYYELALSYIKRPDIHVAEIGTGYGSFYNYVYTIARKMGYTYNGFDILNRIGRFPIEIVGKDGTLTEQQLDNHKNDFDIVYCCNVNQHLSKYQIKKYIEQISAILKLGGYYIATYPVKNNIKPEDYIYHYGMITEYSSVSELCELFIQNGLQLELESMNPQGNISFAVWGCMLRKVA